MQLKFEIVWRITKIGQVIRLQNDINFEPQNMT